MCFTGSSAGEESTCSTGDPGLIPGLGNSPGEGIGYPLQYSWVSLVAQKVKNLPAVWENWLRSLEGGMASYSSIFFPGETPWTEEPHGLKSIGSHRVRHDWATRHSTAQCIYCNPMSQFIPPPSSPLCPHICSLCLHRYFCPTDGPSIPFF